MPTGPLQVEPLPAVPLLPIPALPVPPAAPAGDVAPPLLSVPDIAEVPPSLRPSAFASAPAVAVCPPFAVPACELACAPLPKPEMPTVWLGGPSELAPQPSAVMLLTMVPAKSRERAERPRADVLGTMLLFTAPIAGLAATAASEYHRDHSVRVVVGQRGWVQVYPQLTSACA